MIRTPHILIALLLCTVAGIAEEPADPLDEQLQQLAAKAADIQTLRADFVQERRTPLLKKPMVSRGEIRIRQSQTLWITERPHRTYTRIDDRTLQVYYPEQKTLEVYELDQRLGELAASPIPRMQLLRQRFTIKRMAGEQDEQGEQNEETLNLRLTPRDESLKQYVSAIEVRVDRKTGLAQQVQWSDEDGETTTVRFENVKLNPTLEEDQLSIPLPEKVKIVYPLGESAPNEASQP